MEGCYSGLICLVLVWQFLHSALWAEWIGLYIPHKKHRDKCLGNCNIQNSWRGDLSNGNKIKGRYNFWFRSSLNWRLLEAEKIQWENDHLVLVPFLTLIHQTFTSDHCPRQGYWTVIRPSMVILKLKKNGTTENSYLQSCNQKNQFFSIAPRSDCCCCVWAELHHINAVDSIPRHVQNAFNGAGLGRGLPEWRHSAYGSLSEKTTASNNLEKSLSQDTSATLQPCHSWQTFAECLFSKPPVVNVQQSHLVFDWNATWIFLIPFIISCPASILFYS